MKDERGFPPSTHTESLSWTDPLYHRLQPGNTVLIFHPEWGFSRGGFCQFRSCHSKVLLLLVLLLLLPGLSVITLAGLCSSSGRGIGWLCDHGYPTCPVLLNRRVALFNYSTHWPCSGDASYVLFLTGWWWSWVVERIPIRGRGGRTSE